jgi:hypothetical protein
MGAARKASAPRAIPITFVWTQVRQALQHVAASGAFSPYFAATWPALNVAICFMLEEYSPRIAQLIPLSLPAPTRTAPGLGLTGGK